MFIKVFKKKKKKKTPAKLSHTKTSMVLIVSNGVLCDVRANKVQFLTVAQRESDPEKLYLGQ
jgi:hypothetical protein